MDNPGLLQELPTIMAWLSGVIVTVSSRLRQMALLADWTSWPG
jgi:hypothetical protein